MNETELVYVDSVYIRIAGPEPIDYYIAVGANFYMGSLISLGKTSKLGVQIGSDAVTVIAKVISEKKETLVVSNFFRNNILCFEAATPYNGELEPYEEDE